MSNKDHVQGSSGLRTGGLTTGRLRIGHVGDRRVLPGKKGAPTSDFGFYELYVRIYHRLIGTGGTGGPPATGAFFGFYTVVDDPIPANDGDIYLQGGTINGKDVATDNLWLYDISLDKWKGTDGQHLYVPVTGAFEVADGVALPGFVVSSVGAPAYGTPPSDTFPAVTSETTASNGTCYVSLGVFTETSFLPAASGNRTVSLCITPPYNVTP